MRIISSGWGRGQFVFVLLGAIPVELVAGGLVPGTFEQPHTEVPFQGESQSITVSAISVYSTANVSVGVSSFSGLDEPALAIPFPVAPVVAQPHQIFPAALRAAKHLSAVSGSVNVALRTIQSQRQPGTIRAPGHSIRGQC
jgi:hypothetical protein